MTAISLPARRADVTLLWHWIVVRVRMTLRSPRTLGFTFAFPLVLVVLFNSLNGNVTVKAMGPAGGDVSFAQYYTPSIGVFGLTMACYTTMLVGLATARETGLLKRVRGTPLPLPVYLGSWVAGAVLVGLTSVVLLFVVSVPAFGVDLFPRMLPAAIVTAVLGAACLASVGLALGTLAKTAEQATPLAQLTFLPVSFISGIWFPLDGAPDWLVNVAHFFPLSHIVTAFASCFTPGRSFHAGDLVPIVLWTVAGLAVAVRRFRFEP